MKVCLIRETLLLLAIGPFAYYVLTLWVGIRYFWRRKHGPPAVSRHTPPVSILKPVRGLDFEAYENFASFCQVNYPEYEVLFCVSEADDPVVPVIERIKRDFPSCNIRLLIGAPNIGSSSKVNKLSRLAREASYDLLVISDSDVRVDPSYLRDVAAPFAGPNVGAVTAFFRSETSGGFGASLDASGSAVEFATSALLAQSLEGIRFTLGATMATTKQRLAEIGGFRALANVHADDYELGSRIAALGYRVELARTPVCMVYPRETLREFLRHELRWTIGLRHVRPAGHAAMAFTFGLPWTIIAASVARKPIVAAAYVLTYLLLRFSVYLTLGAWGLQDDVVRRTWWLAPVRDAASFAVWLASFFSNRIRWRGLEFQIENGLLVPVETNLPAHNPVQEAGHSGD